MERRRRRRFETQERSPGLHLWAVVIPAEENPANLYGWPPRLHFETPRLDATENGSERRKRDAAGEAGGGGERRSGLVFGWIARTFAARHDPC